MIGAAPLLVHVDATGSIDPDGIVIAYRWAFGDGIGGTGPITGHTYHSPGTYTLQLTIEDNDGDTAIRAVNIVVQAPNTPPTAVFSFSPTSASPTTSIQFDATASTDPDGSIATYTWDFGDGAVAEGQIAEHAFAQAGRYVVTLTVTDNHGASQQWTLPIVVSEAASSQPAAHFTPETATVGAGELLWFDASASMSPAGTIVQYEWTFGDGTASSGMTVAHTYSMPGTFQVSLSIVDSQGGTDRVTGSVAVETTAEPTPPPPPPGDETLSRTFSWYYEGRMRRLSILVPLDLVAQYAGEPHTVWPNREYGDYILNTLDDSLLRTITQSLRFDCYFRTIKNALAFVQMGVSDEPDAQPFDHPRFPVETLVDGIGDSEDTALLYASLIRTLGYRALLAAVDTDGDDIVDRMVVLVPVGTSFARYGIPEAWKYGGTMYALAATGADTGASPLGTDPWHLTAADFKMVWDASRLNPYPLLAKY